MVLTTVKAIEQQANQLLEKSVIYYKNKAVGAVAATDSEREALNYDQCSKDILTLIKHRWSYHNGGSWPVLLWMMMAACQKMGREDLADRAMAIAEICLMDDEWPEYYDGKNGRLIGKSSRKFQTLTIAGWLLAKLLRENPDCLDYVCFEEDTEAIACTI